MKKALIACISTQGCMWVGELWYLKGCVFLHCLTWSKEFLQRVYMLFCCYTAKFGHELYLTEPLQSKAELILISLKKSHWGMWPKPTPLLSLHKAHLWLVCWSLGGPLWETMPQLWENVESWWEEKRRGIWYSTINWSALKLEWTLPSDQSWLFNSTGLLWIFSLYSFVFFG